MCEPTPVLDSADSHLVHPNGRKPTPAWQSARVLPQRCRLGSWATRLRSRSARTRAVSSGCSSRGRTMAWMRWSPGALRIRQWGSGLRPESRPRWRAARSLGPAGGIHSTNGLERFDWDLKRRMRVVLVFPNREACLRTVTAMCVEQSEEWLSGPTYLGMELLDVTHPRRMVDQKRGGELGGLAMTGPGGIYRPEGTWLARSRPGNRHDQIAVAQSP